MTLTITEALAEIKTINARLAKRREAVMRYLARDAQMRDPLEAEGGSLAFIERERQGIRDLEERAVAIRTAIQAANLSTSLTVRGRTRTVSEWLNWRRDMSAPARQFLAQLASMITQVRQQSTRAGKRVVEGEQEAKFGDVVVSVNEARLAAEVEEMEALLGELDGKLSLVNATTMIEVP